MKIRINRHEFANALSAVTSVVAARTPKPILQCVRIDAMPDHVLLSCTDLEIGLRYTVAQVEVETPGEVLVRADTLSQIVRESNEEILTIEVDSQIVHVRGDDSHFQINAAELDEFPSVPEMAGDAHFQVKLDDFRVMAEWTVFACARESTRYAINGVLFEVGEDLTIVSTDGRRLSKGCCAIERINKDDIPSVIVPIKALSLVKGFSGDADDAISVYVTENQMMIQVSQATVSTSLIEGHFPKYQDVIPQDCNKELMIDTTTFLSGLRRAALLTNEESKGVRLSFSEGMMTLSSRVPEQGEAEIAIPVDYDYDAMDIGFNPQFLIEALKTTRSDRVRFLCSEPHRPGLIEASEQFIYVIMPVSLA